MQTACHLCKGPGLPFVESKRSSHLVKCHQLGKLPGIHEKRAVDVLQITEDERLFEIKPTSNDVLCIFQSEFVRVFEGEFVLEQSLFIVYVFVISKKAIYICSFSFGQNADWGSPVSSMTRYPISYILQ